jgi:hypothetical protein
MGKRRTEAEESSIEGSPFLLRSFSPLRLLGHDSDLKSLG